MTICMVFNGDVTNIRNDFNTLYNSVIYDQKRIMNARMVDAYTFNPRSPVLAEATNIIMQKELSKRQEYCLILVSCEEDEYELTLHSSNLELPLTITRSYRECRLEDPVKRLIESHTAGTILVEEFTQHTLPEDKILTDEDIRLLELAREEKHYQRAKSLVKKVFPGDSTPFSSKQGLKRFCSMALNKDSKLKEKVEADGT